MAGRIAVGGASAVPRHANGVMILISTDAHGIAGFSSYEAQRQFADARAVSRLSPYIHFGQLRLVHITRSTCWCTLGDRRMD